MKRLFFVLYLLVMSSIVKGQYHPTQPDTWQCQDGLQRIIGGVEQYGKPRKNKTVGLFYFIWIGAHGYDYNTGVGPGEGIMPWTPADTLSPYNISELLKEDSINPKWGPNHAFHHWAEPHLGYYISDDQWVIRKHAQMIHDAGVDVIFLDVTNALIYLPIVKQLCNVYETMRKEGNKTPQIAFIINSAPENTMKRLYEQFYAKGLYKDLWFYWKEKPLILCPPEGVTPEIDNFFTVRHAWFASSWEWFGNGKDKWTWADYYPQQPGWHESPDKPEEVSVAVATHAHTNQGRSFHNGKQPEPGNFRSEKGLHFAEQIERALEIDPEFVFITGWNEWIAMRFVVDGPSEMTGKKIDKGDCYFVDQYNTEYSRDIEPMKGGFEDNYYYQMVDFIRRYKGVSPTPVCTQRNEIKIDGKMDDWQTVANIYHDDTGDILHRNHEGYGRFRNYSDSSGRNDIIRTKIAAGKKSLFFYVETKDILTSAGDENWMQLYIGTESESSSWEGFHFMTNRTPIAKHSYIESNTGGWNWDKKQKISYAVQGNKMELEIPYSVLAISPEKFSIQFKWMDNVPANGKITDCMEYGDSAPNNRFRYVFNFDITSSGR